MTTDMGAHDMGAHDMGAHDMGTHGMDAQAEAAASLVACMLEAVGRQGQCAPKAIVSRAGRALLGCTLDEGTGDGLARQASALGVLVRALGASSVSIGCNRLVPSGPFGTSKEAAPQRADDFWSRPAIVSTSIRRRPASARVEMSLVVCPYGIDDRGGLVPVTADEFLALNEGLEVDVPLRRVVGVVRRALSSRRRRMPSAEMLRWALAGLSPAAIYDEDLAFSVRFDWQ